MPKGERMRALSERPLTSLKYKSHGQMVFEGGTWQVTRFSDGILKLQRKTPARGWEIRYFHVTEVAQ